MLYDELKKFYLLNPDENGMLVFHTSILNFPDEMLEKIVEEIPWKWVFPENVYYELQFLRKSSVFGKKVGLVFRLGKKRKAVYIEGNLEEFYYSQAPLTALGTSKTVRLIFIFGDQLKLKEFLKNVSEKENYYVFFHNRWEHTQYSSDECIASVKVARQWLRLLDCVGHVKTIRNGAREKIKIDSVQKVTSKGIGGKEIAEYSKAECVGEGGESKVYGISEQEDIVLKIFKEYPSSNHLKKMEYLMLLQQGAKFRGREQVELPKGLLYNGGKLVGIAVKRISGNSLTDAMVDTSIEFDIAEVLQDLALVMLELNLCHMLVVDLDGDNIILDKNKKMHLIDTDSFQLMHYGAGVCMRPHYMHKELVGKQGNFMIEPRYQDFAFGVLMFKLLVCGTYSPLFQKAALDAASENRLFWGTYEFPYKVAEYEEMEVNAICLEKWKGVPVILQKAFVEAFTFKKDFSIGYWMHIFLEAMK
ncbi:hypothetical protein ABXS75_00565 [Roseburia hominis]